jgi:hypothetical protein
LFQGRSPSSFLFFVPCYSACSVGTIPPAGRDCASRSITMGREIAGQARLHMAAQDDRLGSLSYKEEDNHHEGGSTSARDYGRPHLWAKKFSWTVSYPSEIAPAISLCAALRTHEDHAAPILFLQFSSVLLLHPWFIRVNPWLNRHWGGDD